MKNDRRNRRSIRLKDYDYAQAGAYFVNICTHQHVCLLGEIVESKMLLNEFGRIVQEEWMKTEQLRPNVSCGKFVVMPNHFHGVLMINYDGRGVLQYARTPHTPPLSLNHHRRQLAPLYVGSNPPSPNKSTISAKHPGKNSGNAIIMNTSSAMRMTFNE